MKHINYLIITILIVSNCARAEIHNVPDEYESIQAAIDSSANGDTVLINRGVYHENINFMGKGITVGGMMLFNEYEEEIPQTILDGDSSGSVVTFDHNEDENSVLYGLLIRHGLAENGGGIYISDSSPVLDHLAILENEAERYGGGIFCSGESSPLIRNTRLSGNSAGLYGGGIAGGNGSQLFISEVQIFDNSSNRSGGGLSTDTSQMSARGLICVRNRAMRNGSGLYLTRNSNISLESCRIDSNVAIYSGTGVYISNSTDVRIMGSQINANHCTSNGGGILIHNSSAAIYDSYLCNNHAESGAAIRSVGSELIMHSVILQGNQSSLDGSVIYGNNNLIDMDHVLITNNTVTNSRGCIRLTDGILNIDHSTIVQNDRAIYYSGDFSLNIRNSILWNTGNEIKVLGFGENTLLNMEYSVYENDDCDAFYPSYADSAILGEGNTCENPQFVDLENGDFHLTAGSSSIDAGDPDDDYDTDGTRADIGYYSFHQRDIDIVEREIRFEEVVGGSSGSREFYIPNIGGTPLTITMLSLQPEGYPFYLTGECEGLVIAPYSSMLKNIIFSPVVDGNYETILRIESDDPDEGMIEIPVTGSTLDINSVREIAPQVFRINEVYPNPFNSSTSITYIIPERSSITLRVYDTQGRLVKLLSEGVLSAGTHKIVMDGSDLSSGVYLVKIAVGGMNLDSGFKKFILIR